MAALMPILLKKLQLQGAPEARREGVLKVYAEQAAEEQVRNFLAL